VSGSHLKLSGETTLSPEFHPAISPRMVADRRHSAGRIEVAMKR
jgi:hypothetical protein